MTGEGEALFKAICRKPKDFARYFVYADWLEEQGKTAEAECWRLLGEFGKYPIRWPGLKFTQYHWDDIDLLIESEWSQLPHRWLKRLRHYKKYYTFAIYNSRDEAFRDAVATYCRAKPKARQGYRDTLAAMVGK